MPSARTFTKQEILAALNHTKSIRAAARYAGVSYQHFKKWAKLYIDKESKQTLFDKYKNPSGKGIPKFFGGGDEPYLLDIIEGRVDASYFTPARIKQRMISEGYLKEECKRCKFNEQRVVDGKVPLLFYFEDGNKRNYQMNNICLLCYNCYFLTVGNMFSNKELDTIEDYKKDHLKKKETWELDEYHLERLKDLGLLKEEIKEVDPNDYINGI